MRVIPAQSSFFREDIRYMGLDKAVEKTFFGDTRNTWECSYCGSTNTAHSCESCGAPNSTRKKKKHKNLVSAY